MTEGQPDTERLASVELDAATLPAATADQIA